MNKKLVLSTILISLLSGCSSSLLSSSTSEEPSSIEDNPSSGEFTYTSKKYTNPARIIQLDGSERFVTIADPDILVGEDGYFYLYPTNLECEMGELGVMFDLGPIFKSDDLQTWRWVGSVFLGQADAVNWNADAMNTGGVWAPSIIKIGNRYNYYYSLSGWGDPNPGIGAASAPTPVGPWTHYGKLVDQEMTGIRNGIDPHVMIEDEKVYLFWGSFFGIGVVQLTDDGLETFYPPEAIQEHVGYVIPNNNGTKMNINVNYEGSFIMKKGEYFYYFGSQGSCCSGQSSTYTVKVGRSQSIFGPYVASDGQEMTTGNYGDIVVAPSEEVKGTGGNVVIQDYAGDDWLIYHGFYRDGLDPNQRVLFMDKLLWDQTTGYPYIEGRQATVSEQDGPTIVDHQTDN